MIRFILILCVCVSMVGCNQKSSIEKINYNTANNIYIDTVLADQLKPVLKDWLSFYSINLDKFTPIDTLSVDWSELKKNTFIYYKKFTPAEEKYMPGSRSYSPDRKKFIDLIEDSKDIVENHFKGWVFEDPYSEQHVYLYNRTDSTSMLLSTKNKTNFADDGYWLDNDRFILAGVDKRANNKMYYLQLYRVDKADVIILCLPDSTISDDKSYLREVILPKRLKR